MLEAQETEQFEFAAQACHFVIWRQGGRHVVLEIERGGRIGAGFGPGLPPDPLPHDLGAGEAGGQAVQGAAVDQGAGFVFGRPHPGEGDPMYSRAA